jgi:hypothetical protein
METCAVCREEVTALQTVADALAVAVPPQKAPARLKGLVMSEIRSGSERAVEPAVARAPARRRWGWALAPAAALAVVAVLAVVIFAGGGGGARVIHAQVTAPGATALVRVSGGHAEMTLTGMPQTRPGRVYEVWLKRAGAPQPTDALFTVSSAGSATVGVPGNPSGVREVLVTAEPLGGSRAPTSKPVIVAKLS